MSYPRRPGESIGPDLSFRVFGKALHPDWLPVKAHERVAKDEWRADLRVLDRGHAVTWGFGNHRITEILSPRGLQLPSEGLLYEAPVGDDRSTSLRPASVVEYQAGFGSEEAGAELFGRLAEEIALDRRRYLLTFEFGAASRLAASGLTRIFVEARARGLLVHAFHTFPEERTIVRTQSLFECRLPIPTV